MFPFNIQIKGFVIGLLFAYFVIPWLQSILSGRLSSRATAAA